MAAWQGDGAVVVLPACRAARRAPGDLSLHRQQSWRGGCRQAQARRRHHRPSDAAAEVGRPRQRHAGARAPHRRIRRSRRTRSPPHGASRARRFSTAPERQDCSPRAAPTAPRASEDQLARLDAYLCDVKDLQIRDGLHVYGRAPDAQRREEFLASLAQSNPQAPAETLAARFDQAASTSARRCSPRSTASSWRRVPSGAPTRGRADVLPTGRNLYAIDPRAVPTRSAVVLAEKAAKELLRRHLQDHGEYPRALVMDVWGSATMRTGGEDLALALLLMGARPVWDHGSARVSGIRNLAASPSSIIRAST